MGKRPPSISAAFVLGCAVAACGAAGEGNAADVDGGSASETSSGASTALATSSGGASSSASRSPSTSATSSTGVGSESAASASGSSSKGTTDDVDASTGGSRDSGTTAASSSGSSSSSSSDAGSGSGLNCDVAPVTPGATTQAKNLLCYLYSIYGNHVLAGQQETSWDNPTGDITWYANNGLKYPAILGGDFLYRDSNSCTAVTSSTTRGIAYWNAGGLTMFRYHMGMPGAGLTCVDDCYDDGPDCAESSPAAGTLDNAVTAGTPENTSLNSKLDYVAAQIQAMAAANVPIILALFHEAQPNGWFWWSKGTGAQYVALWKYAFTYLTSTKGLTNIIWLMPFSGLNGTSTNADEAFFPGKDVVDLSGPDYNTGAYGMARTIVGGTMPIPLHESNAVDPSTWFPSESPFVLWNIWAGYETTALSTVKAAFADPHTITRDLVPSLK